MPAIPESFPAAARAPRRRPSVRAAVALGLLGVFLTVLGARLWLVWADGTAMPYWDQWPAEGWLLIKPLREGRLTWDALVAPHLEHRILWTRLLVLGLFLGNGGQWDAQVEMTVNAAIYAGVATALAATLRRALPGAGWHAGLLAGVALLFALPFGWENTLGGFQSVTYFLIGLSLATLWGLGTRPAFSPGWWAGAAAAMAACFSMGSGFFAAAVVGVWRTMRALKERRWPGPGETATLLVCAGVVALGWGLKTDVAAHAALRAESPVAWLGALGRDLAFPWVDAPRRAWGVYVPLIVLGVAWLAARRDGAFLARRGRAVELLLLGGGWVVLQGIALALTRAGEGVLPPSRYLDVLSLGVLVNALAAWLLATSAPRRGRVPACLAAGAWTLLLLGGLADRTREDFTGLPERARRYRTEERNVRAYLAGDREALRNKPLHDIPYPVAAHLEEYLDDPAIRPALPAVVREPVRVELEETTGVFAPGAVPPALGGNDPAPPWGSFGPGGAAGEGKFRARLRPAAGLPYLRWEFAGEPGGEGTALRMEDGQRRTLQALTPARMPGERWRTEYRRAPDGEWHLVAEDRSVARWLAFRAPTEVGGLSYRSGWLLRRGGWVFGSGVALLAAGAVPGRGGREARS